MLLLYYDFLLSCVSSLKIDAFQTVEIMHTTHLWYLTCKRPLVDVKYLFFGYSFEPDLFTVRITFPLGQEATTI